MKKQDKIYYSILGVIFIIFILSFGIFEFAKKDNTFSELENRMLATKPKFSFKNLINEGLTKKYEKYISDQFPFRNFWVKLKAKNGVFLGKQDNNNVFIGKDGYLIENFKGEEENSIHNKVRYIQDFCQKNTNINKYFMLVPNSTKILQEKLPKNAPVKDQYEYLNKFQEALKSDITFVPLERIFQEKKNEYIFYKTDHHWTTKGAYYAYVEFAKKVGIRPLEHYEFNLMRKVNGFYGTLYSKVLLNSIKSDTIELFETKEIQKYTVKIDNEIETQSVYNLESLKKKDKYSVFFGGNHGLVKITNRKPQRHKNILIIKDSYANSFVPYLIPHYKQITMIDLRHYRDNISDYIKENNIDEVLLLYNINSFSNDNSIKNIKW